MGYIRFGIPNEEAFFFKELFHLTTFVEGGTYKGETAKQMASHFQKVITIEKSDVMWNLAKKRLSTLSNVTLLHGDTREFLPKILEEEDNILFWLDSHWSGGDTYGKDDECPLLEELSIIFNYSRNYVILIDDARLFLAPPPSPHDFHNWPSIKQILRILPPDWEIIVFDEVIYLYPSSSNEDIKSYFQKKLQ